MIRLLQAASEGRRDLRVSAFDEAQVCWAVERGLGPLLVYTATDDPAAVTAPSWPFLQVAHLTAQILGGEQLDAMGEIIDACVGHTPLLTLLKGISICEQHYPQPYLRPMRDIDFLLEEVEHPVVESILFKLGYRQQSTRPPEMFERHHHSMPFYHPQRGVWIEVHRRLVSGNRGAAADPVFSLEHVTRQRQLSEFQGRKVYRLSNEFQIVYISAHWCWGRSVADGLIALLDIIYLLRNTQEQLHWELIVHWLHGSLAALHLALVVMYLQKYHLIDIAPEILQKLISGQPSVSSVNLKILQIIIDRYVIEGKDFGPRCSAKDLNHVWVTLLSPGSPLHNLILVLQHFLRLRRRLQRVRSIFERTRYG